MQLIDIAQIVGGFAGAAAVAFGVPAAAFAIIEQREHRLDVLEENLNARFQGFFGKRFSIDFSEGVDEDDIVRNYLQVRGIIGLLERLQKSRQRDARILFEPYVGSLILALRDMRVGLEVSLQGEAGAIERHRIASPDFSGLSEQEQVQRVVSAIRVVGKYGDHEPKDDSAKIEYGEALLVLNARNAETNMKRHFGTYTEIVCTMNALKLDYPKQFNDLGINEPLFATLDGLLAVGTEFAQRSVGRKTHA